MFHVFLSISFYGQAQSVSLEDGLIAHYDFNGNPDDRTVNGYHGTVIGGELTVDRFGNCNHAYGFDNSPERISIPIEVLNGKSSFSVSLWVKTDFSGVTLTAANAQRNNEFFIQLVSQGHIGTTVRANPSRRGQRVDGSIQVVDGDWHHIVVTRNHNTGEMEIYVDGQLDVRTNLVFGGNQLPREPLEIDPDGLHLGLDQDCVGGCWDPNQQLRGTMDDVWFFDRVINRNEVLALRDIDESNTIPDLTLPSTIELCNGSAVLDAGSGFESYDWNTGETTQQITVTSAGTYTIVASYLGCVYNSAVDVLLANVGSLSIEASETFLSCDGSPITLSAVGDDFDSFVWSNGETGRHIIINTPGEYFVVGESVCGSATSETIKIYGDDLTGFFIPNTFTPNGDRINDTFVIDSRLRGAELVIYNRWGKRLFQAPEYNNDWGGADLPEGTYYFSISHVCLSNDIRGWVQILR